MGAGIDTNALRNSLRTGGKNLGSSSKKKSKKTVEYIQPPAVFDNNLNNLLASGTSQVLVGTYVITWATSGDVTITFPKTGSALVGTGTANFIPQFSDANTLANSNLKMTGSNVLSLAASAIATLTVPRTGVASTDTVAALTPDANVAMNCNLANRFTLTPGEDEAITPSGGYAGQTVTLEVITSGATSFTLTFASPFKSTGTLATGVTTAKKFIVEFYNDGTDLLETRRTAAL